MKIKIVCEPFVIVVFSMSDRLLVPEDHPVMTFPVQPEGIKVEELF